MSYLILVRHGQSVWNLEKKFTGWVDVDLTENGKSEATKAGELIKMKNIDIDIYYSSFQLRAKNTLNLIMEVLNDTKLFKVIPYKRPSSSFGYSQAVNGTWEQYKKETGNKLAVRTRFKDSVDFIGWYTNKSSSILKISKTDAFNQYVAYHEGWGNYKHYKKNKKIINLAKRVEKQSNVYKKQLKECSSSLSRNKYIIF